MANFSTLGEAIMSEEEASFVHVPMDIRVDEIVDSLSRSLPIRVDQYNSSIVRLMCCCCACPSMAAASYKPMRMYPRLHAP